MGWAKVRHSYDAPALTRAAGVVDDAMARARVQGAQPYEQGGYVAGVLPRPLSKSATPPWVRELTRLMERRATGLNELRSLHALERELRMPGGSLRNVPDSVIRSAGSELRWLARREVPSPALARLLDQFELGVLRPALLRLREAAEQRARALQQR